MLWALLQSATVQDGGRDDSACVLSLISSHERN